MGSSAVSKRSGKHCIFVHDIRRGSQCFVGRFQIIFSFGRIPFVWVPAEWKKRNYMTFLLGFNIVACAWRLFLHVKVNIMLAGRRWVGTWQIDVQLWDCYLKIRSCQLSSVSVYNRTISRNTTTISKLVNTSFVIWSGQCIMLRNTALL